MFCYTVTVIPREPVCSIRNLSGTALGVGAGNADFGADSANSGGVTHVCNKSFGNGSFQPSYFEASREARLKIRLKWPGPKTLVIHVCYLSSVVVFRSPVTNTLCSKLRKQTRILSKFSFH